MFAVFCVHMTPAKPSVGYSDGLLGGWQVEQYVMLQADSFPCENVAHGFSFHQKPECHELSEQHHRISTLCRSQGSFKRNPKLRGEPCHVLANRQAQMIEKVCGRCCCKLLCFPFLLGLAWRGQFS